MENTNNNVVEKEAIKITVETPAAFDAVGEIKITSSNELAKMVNDVFSQIFADYYGCKLDYQYQPDKGGYVIVPNLYFKVLPNEAYADDTRIFAYRPLGGKTTSDIVGRVQRISQLAGTPGVKIEITEDGKSALADFLVRINGKIEDFKWQEAYQPMPSESETLIRTYKLDIIKLVELIFGKEDAEGAKLYYQVTPVAPILNQYKKSDNWSLCILRLNHATEAKAAELLGFNIPSQSVIPNIITAKTGMKE